MTKYDKSDSEDAVRTMLTRLKALHTFLGWTCTFDWTDPTCRTLRVHRERKDPRTLAATYIVEMRPDEGAPAYEMASRLHFVMTRDSIPDVVADNLAQLTSAQKFWPDNELLSCLYDLMPTGAGMSFGIAARRLELLGFAPANVRRNLLRLLGHRHMRTDLRRPIDGASILRWGKVPRDDQSTPPWALSALGL